MLSISVVIESIDAILYAIPCCYMGCSIAILPSPGYKNMYYYDLEFYSWIERSESVRKRDGGGVGRNRNFCRKIFFILKIQIWYN